MIEENGIIKFRFDQANELPPCIFQLKKLVGYLDILVF